VKSNSRDLVDPLQKLDIVVAFHDQNEAEAEWSPLAERPWFDASFVLKHADSVAPGASKLWAV
jgi:hypothetical protein